MKVLAKPVDYASCPSTVAAYVNPDQVHVTLGKEYTVHALAVFGDVTHVQVVDDLGYPSWKPAWLFNVTDSRVAEDWICGVFPNDDPQVIIGPRFVAQDQVSYCRMVELDVEQVERFWQRLDAQKEGTG